jgi:7-cyano-7-deazaguanine synthase
MTAKPFMTLLSGGLDSVVSSYAVAREGGAGEAVFFDYGQRALKRERKAAQAIAARLGLGFRVIPLPFLEQVTRTALVMNDQIIPQIKPDKLDDRSETEKSAQAVWVPNRNGLFLNVAAALAEGLGLSRLVVGFNAEEAATFPDNSANFVHKAEEFFRLSTLAGLEVVAPTLGMNKTEIVQYGLKLDAPFDLIWSCYRGGRKLCGACESCLRSIRAYRNAGVWPQLSYRYEETAQGVAP